MTMTYEQLCPPSNSLGDGICVTYFLYQMEVFAKEHPVLWALIGIVGLILVFSPVIFDAFAWYMKHKAKGNSSEK